MQVSWSPIASWISTAATEESTPPDRPQMTLPLPDLVRGSRRSRCSRKAAMRPVAGAAATRCTKLASSCAPVGRVHDLGVELHAVEAARVVGDHGDRARRRWWPTTLEALRQADDPVAVAHPHLVALARLPEAVEERAARSVTSSEGAAELAVLGRPRPCRRAGRTWPAGRSRCRAPARRARRRCRARAACRRRAPRPGRRRG